MIKERYLNKAIVLTRVHCTCVNLNNLRFHSTRVVGNCAPIGYPPKSLKFTAKKKKSPHQCQSEEKVNEIKKVHLVMITM